MLTLENTQAGHKDSPSALYTPVYSEKGGGKYNSWHQNRMVMVGTLPLASLPENNVWDLLQCGNAFFLTINVESENDG